MLQQVLRDSDAQWSAALDRAAAVLASEKALMRQISSLQRDAVRCRKMAADALMAHDEALARRRLTEAREHDRLVSELADELSTLQGLIRELKRHLSGLRLRQTRERGIALALSARHAAAGARRRLAASALETMSTAETTAEFQRYAQRIEAAVDAEEARYVLCRDLACGSDESPADLDQEVADELAALKRAMSQNHPVEP